VRVPSLTLAVAGAAAVLAPSMLADAAPRGRAEPVAWREGGVSAADLLAEVRTCHRISHGRYRTDPGRRATVAVCGTRHAVFWKADMDIDCDGRSGRRCNRRSDPYFARATAYQQSDGRFLSSERLPYVVVPAAGPLWKPADDGVRGGAVAAVVYKDRVQYAVVGDIGSRDVIGEASYATAKGLGINPDPRHGGVASGVTYIVFKNSQAKPIEDHTAAVTVGQRLARRFVEGR
jgi:hypothetical protein